MGAPGGGGGGQEEEEEEEEEEEVGRRLACHSKASGPTGKRKGGREWNSCPPSQAWFMCVLSLLSIRGGALEAARLARGRGIERDREG